MCYKLLQLKLIFSSSLIILYKHFKFSMEKTGYLSLLFFFIRSSCRFYHLFVLVSSSKLSTFIHSNSSDWYLCMHGINFQYCWHSCAYEIAFHYTALEIIQFTHFNQIMTCVTCCYMDVYVFMNSFWSYFAQLLSPHNQYCWQFCAKHRQPTMRNSVFDP